MKTLYVKRYYFTIIMLLSGLTLMAIPAKHIRRVLTLTDGTQVEATLQGDESLHYWLTDDGRAIRPLTGGRYQVTNLTQLKARHKSRVQKRNESRMQRHNLPQHKAALTGSKRGLVILVNFTDKMMSASTDPHATYVRFFNQEGFSDHGMTGSVHDYFLDQSYNQFDLTFDVVGPLTLSKTMSYYGGNSDDDKDINAPEMIREALLLAANQVNYADYDWDGDGYVDQVYVIYAGYGEAQGGGDDTIWPHEWSLSSAQHYGRGEGAITLDGVTIDTYACSNELRGTNGNLLDGIGTACHEFSHCLGIPDFYDTQGDNSAMLSWDLMDYGSYNNDGCTPSAYTSYERWYAGWLEPIEINGEVVISDMEALESEGEAYILYNEGNHNEYYLLENRQPVKWDKAQDGHGLLIVHVDYESQYWMYNVVNSDANHLRMSIVPADNMLSRNTTGGDTFPYNRINSFTNETTPASIIFNENTDGSMLLNKPVENIQESAKGTISFTAMEGVIEVPVLNPVTEYSSTSFIASWNTIEGATSYLLSLTEKQGQAENPSDAIMLTENFLKSCYSTSAMTGNIANSLDNYLSTTGWTGECLYPSKQGLKMFKGSALGNITTPNVGVPDTDHLSIYIYAQPETGSKGTMKVTLSNNMAATISFTQAQYFLLNTPEISENVKITLTAQDKLYLGELTIYDGDYEAKDLEKAPRKASTTTLETEDTQYAFSGLTTNSTYTLRVAAVTPEGNSNWSAALTIRLSDLTSIKTIHFDEYVQPASHVTYDLTGRRIPLKVHPRKGIYIINGRKVVVK